MVGTNATLLPNITVGHFVFVGAGAVVTKDIKDGVIVVGVPAKKIRDFKPVCDLKIFG